MCADKKSEGVEITGKALVAGGVAMVTAQHPELAVLAGLQPVADKVVEVFARRAATWFDQYRKPWKNVAEPVAEFVNRMEASEEVQDTVFQAFQRLREIADPLAIRVLAELVRDYADRNARPDTFFRSFGQLLTDLDADELRALAVCVGVASRVSEHRYVVLKASRSSTSADLEMWGLEDDMNTQVSLPPTGHVANGRVRRVLVALDRSGCAAFGASRVDVNVEMLVEDARRIRGYLLACDLDIPDGPASP